MPTPSPITRTTPPGQGMLMFESFASGFLSSWTVTVVNSWTARTEKQMLCNSERSLPLIVGTPSGIDAAGAREPKFIDLNDGDGWCMADGATGIDSPNGAWRSFLYHSDDGWLTNSGPTQPGMGFNDGSGGTSFDSFWATGLFWKSSTDGWRYDRLYQPNGTTGANADTIQPNTASGGNPAGFPYPTEVWKNPAADPRTGTWTFVTRYNTGTTPPGVFTSSSIYQDVENLFGTLNLWYQWWEKYDGPACGYSTGTSSTGPWSGNNAFTPAFGNVENLDFWVHDGSGDMGGTRLCCGIWNAFDTIPGHYNGIAFADSPTDLLTATGPQQQRFFQRVSDTAFTPNVYAQNVIGVPRIVRGLDEAPIFWKGRQPFSYDADAVLGNDGTTGPRYRTIVGSDLMPSPGGAYSFSAAGTMKRTVATYGGPGMTYWVRFILQVDGSDASGPSWGPVLLGDGVNTGYWFEAVNTHKVNANKLSGGSPSLLQSGTGTLLVGWPASIQILSRVDVASDGMSVRLRGYQDGELQVDYTDSSSPLVATSTVLAIRGNPNVGVSGAVIRDLCFYGGPTALADKVTVTGVGSQQVVLRCAGNTARGGWPMAKANGVAGTASVPYGGSRASFIQVGPKLYTPADNGDVWPGDTFSISAQAFTYPKGRSMMAQF